MNEKYGGYAFPVMTERLALSNNDNYVAVREPEGGMWLRDYFAAHAPANPEVWFEPDFMEKPQAVYDHDHPNLPICNECECLISNWQERSDWCSAYTRALMMQWPYAWADAMLAERNRTK